MAKGKNFQSDNFILSLRLRGAEAVRFWAVFDTAKQRNPYAERTDVIRELLGLDELKILTRADLLFFRTGEKDSKAEAQIFNDKDTDTLSGRKIAVSPERERIILGLDTDKKDKAA